MRHATDRWDWTIIAECPNNGEHVEGKTDEDDPEHITIEASAECSVLRAREAIPIEECGICGAELDFIVEESPTEILTDGGRDRHDVASIARVGPGPADVNPRPRGGRRR